MRFHLIHFATILSIAAAIPISPCNTAKDNATHLAQDISILNYALTLEHLEYAFYRDGLANLSKYDFPTEDSYDKLVEIGKHEATHVDVLKSVIESLNGTAVTECIYDFGYKDVTGFLAVARALERTGVSAYTGVINKIHNPDLVTAGATIATVEARHASYLNSITGYNPFPSAFDVPLNAMSIVSIAGGFIKSCDYDIGVVPFPQVNVTTQTKEWAQVQFSDTLLQPSVQFYCTWLYSSAQEHTILYSNYYCNIPVNATGDVYLYITNYNSNISLDSDKSVVAGPTVVTI